MRTVWGTRSFARAEAMRWTVLSLTSRVQDGGREDEQELGFDGFAHEGRYRHGDEHPHERARVWIYETLPLANTKDATGISFERPHYARPAFTKCFLNIPRAM